MGAVNRRSAGENSLRRNLLWAVIVLLGLVLAYLVYFRIHLPGRNAVSLDEENLPALKVEVKNGCGVENLATDYTAFLSGKNIDVVRMGDTPQPI